MALIEFRIDKDLKGNTCVVPTVKRLDPGDEVQLTTDTPGAALQFSGDSPFLAPHTAKIHLLSQAAATAEVIQVARSVALTPAFAVCGVRKEGDIFVAWGGGFPDIGS